MYFTICSLVMAAAVGQADPAPATPSKGAEVLPMPGKRRAISADDEKELMTLRLAAKFQDRESNPVLWATLQLALGMGLHHVGETKEAEEVMRPAWEEITKARKEDELAYIELRQEYASILLELAKFEDAENVYKTLLPAASRVFGPSHRKNLAVRADYLFLLFARGRMPEIESEAHSLLNVGVPVLGVDDQSMLDVRLRLADALESQKKHVQAEREYRTVLGAMERAVGATDTQVLMLRYNLAICLRGQSKIDEALKMVKEVESVARQRMSSNEPMLKDLEALRKDLEVKKSGRP